jgi:hypothetical protein
MVLHLILSPWRRLEAAVAARLYRLGLACATRPVLVLYACMVVIIVLSYPAAVYLDHTINGAAGHEPLRFWQQPPPAAVTEGAPPDDGRELTRPLLQIRQVLATLGALGPRDAGSDVPAWLPPEPPPSWPPDADSGAVAADAYPHGVLERHLLLRLQHLQHAVATYRSADAMALAALCYRPPGTDACLVSSPLDYWNGSEAAVRADPDVRATLSRQAGVRSVNAAGLPLSLRSVFGGLVVDDPTGCLTYARSMVVTYVALAHTRAALAHATGFWAEVWRSDAVRALQPLVTVHGRPNLDTDGHRHFVYRPTAAAPTPTAPAGSGGSGSSSHDDWATVLTAPAAAAAAVVAAAAALELSAEVWLLGVAYLVVFLYVSLSLGRVELVRSKFGLGLSAVVTVIFALLMSVGVCHLLGSPLTLLPWYAGIRVCGSCGGAWPILTCVRAPAVGWVGREILPFLLMIIGVENTFTITNAVTGTSLDLPVKERVAIGPRQGQSLWPWAGHADRASVRDGVGGRAGNGGTVDAAVADDRGGGHARGGGH